MSEKTTQEQMDEDFRYLQMKDENGNRYCFPMVSILDEGYDNHYISMMKIKESDPATFNKILNWG